MRVGIMCSEFDVGPVIVFGSIAVAKFNEFVGKLGTRYPGGMNSRTGEVYKIYTNDFE